MSNLPTVNSHNSWSRLEEAMLGDVYPDSWYSHLPDEVEDTFCRLGEITRADLAIIENKLQDFGVQVRRPNYEKIENHLAPDTETLKKPDITPRDYCVVIGNQFVIGNSSKFEKPESSWHHLYLEYGSNCVISHDLERSVSGKEMINWHRGFNGANVVRYGDTILWDNPSLPKDKKAQATTDLQELFPNYRFHIVDNGGHIDSCFHTVRPGLLLTSHYFEDYETYFPGWECIAIQGDPEFARHNNNGKIDARQVYGNGRWWLQGVDMPMSFNKHIVQFAHDWVGEPQETYFEVNALVVDEKNILILGENDAVFRRFEELGITAHSVPFRARTFWDGGLHCLTVDVRRQSKIENVFEIDTSQYL